MNPARAATTSSSRLAAPRYLHADRTLLGSDPGAEEGPVRLNTRPDTARRVLTRTTSPGWVRVASRCYGGRRRAWDLRALHLGLVLRVAADSSQVGCFEKGHSVRNKV